MSAKLTSAVTLTLLGVLPLVLYAGVEDVFLGPWRAGLCLWLGFFLISTGLGWMTGRRQPAPGLVDLPWALFAVWVLASVAWSRNPADSLRRAFELSGATAGFWLGIELGREWRKLGLAALLAAALCTIYGIAQVAGLDPLPWSTRFARRAFGTLANPDYYAGHILLVLPVAVAVGFGARRFRILYGLLTALLAAGFLLSQVRGAWLAAGATVLLSLLLGRRELSRSEKRYLGRAGAGAGVLLLVGLLAVPSLRGRMASVVAFDGYDATGRRYLWSIASRIFRESPLAGFGIDGFKFEFPRYQILGASSPLPQFRPYNYSEHAHNEALQFGAELGLLGLGLFLWGLASWGLRWQAHLKYLAAAGRRGEWWMQAGIGLGLAGTLFYSAVNFPLQIVPTAVLWWIMLGASLARMPSRARGWPLPRGLAIPAGGALIAVALLGAFLTLRDLTGSAYHQQLRGLGERGEWGQAAYFGEKAQALLGHDYRVARWLSRVCVAAGMPERAEELFSIRQKLHPYLVDSLADRAALYRRSGRDAQAEREYLNLVAIAPNFADAWGELGTIRFSRGDFAGAAEAFGKAAYYQPSDAAWPHNQASALGQLERYPEALAADREAIRRNPNFQEAYVGLALSARALGRTTEAHAAARRAYQLNPRDPRAAALLQQLSSR